MLPCIFVVFIGSKTTHRGSREDPSLLGDAFVVGLSFEPSSCNLLPATSSNYTYTILAAKCSRGAREFLPPAEKYPHFAASFERTPSTRPFS
jgi:hypothetical protein